MRAPHGLGSRSVLSPTGDSGAVQAPHPGPGARCGGARWSADDISWLATLDDAARCATVIFLAKYPREQPFAGVSRVVTHRDGNGHLLQAIHDHLDGSDRVTLEAIIRRRRVKLREQR